MEGVAIAGPANADADRLQLRELTRRVRQALLPPGSARASSLGANAGAGRDRRDIDAGYAEFSRLSERAATLCGALCEAGGSGGEVKPKARRGQHGRVGHGRTTSAVSMVSSMSLSLSSVRSRRGHGADLDGARASGGEPPETPGSGVTPGGAAKHGRRVSVAAVTDLFESVFESGGDGDGVADAVLPKLVADESLEAVREWRSCLEELAAAHKANLAETYKQFEHFATPEILDALFAERKSRAQVVGGWMKNFGAYKRMESDVRSKWEAQFRNYEQVVHELGKVSELVQSVESGISPHRTIQECVITPRGDTMLEFANTAMHWKPVLRFVVSSHMLAETSPIFARMFAPRQPGGGGGAGDGLYVGVGGVRPPDGTDDLADELPPPPKPFTCADGSRVLLYRMPQLELNENSALTILLHAAHMHNDRVPREVTFERFVAIAEVCLRYRCTSPLELFVEHRWLPEWMHKATDAMPDGLVTISYVFGLRRLFTRVTKSAILNIVDEKELASKTWPARIKERVWAVRCAKMAQVSSACTGAIEEYLRPPKQPGDEGEEGDDGSNTTPVATPPSSLTTSLTPSFNLFFAHTAVDGPRTFTSTPRCPKGSHWCDATNLGWLMLIYNELQLLSAVLHPELLLSQPDLACQAQPPPRSLAHIVDALRGVTSPPNPVHPGRASVCDPAPAFREAINDVYNSVAGLTLFDIDGRRHGWALSRHRRDDPQPVLRVRGLDEDAAEQRRDELGRAVADPEVYGSDVGVAGECDAMGPAMSVAEEVFDDEELCFEILSSLDNFGDLHAAAMVNRGVHEVYKKYEVHLMRNIIRASRSKSVSFPDGWDRDPDGQPLSPTLENKMLRLIVGPEPGNFTQSLPEPPLAGNQPDGRREAIRGPPTTTDGVPTESSSQITSPTPPYSSVADETPSPRSTAFAMTDEEARRIIWPPEPSPLLSPQLSMPEIPTFQPDDMAALDCGKYEANEIVRIEDKTLVIIGNKQLREDLDRRVGLIS